MIEAPLRVLPVVLSNGNSVVKGQKFINNRVVGTVKSSLRIQADRNVDEVILIDVQKDERLRVESTIRNTELVSDFIRVPFGVGGGLSNINHVRQVLRLGADKVLLGHQAIHCPEVIAECAREFGSQAICVALNFDNENLDSFSDCCARGLGLKSDLGEMLNVLEFLGAGEFLITVRNLDGTRRGPAIQIAQKVVSFSKLPIIYSGGVGSLADFSLLAKAGVSGVAAGAFFQFSQYSPGDVKDFLTSEGHRVRTEFYSS